MSKVLYERPEAEEIVFQLEKDLLDATGKPWIVVDETMWFDDEDEDYHY